MLYAREYEGLATEHLVQRHAQEIVPEDVFAQLRHILLEVSYRFGIYLHHLYGPSLGQEILGEHAHSRAHFQYWQCRAGIHGVGYAACYILVGEEVLAELLLGSDAFHLCCMLCGVGWLA